MEGTATSRNPVRLSIAGIYPAHVATNAPGKPQVSMKRSLGTQTTLSVVLLLAYGLILNLALPSRDLVYVPANLVAAIFVLLLAIRGYGLSVGDLGLRPTVAVKGSVWGGICGLTVGIPVFLGVIFLPTNSDRLVGLETTPDSALGLAFRLLVWIPVGTVLLEELAFRGFLPRAFRMNGHNLVGAHIRASACFGLWHLGHAINAARILDSPLEAAGSMAVILVGTFLGGLMYGLVLEWRSSLAACAAMHWTLNALTTAALFIRYV